MFCVLHIDKIYAAVKTCVFIAPEKLFLGYVVWWDGLLVNKLKIEALRRVIRKVQSFHGLAVQHFIVVSSSSSVIL